MACSTGMENGVNMAASCQMDETPFPGCLNYQPWRVPKRSNGTVNKFHGLTFAAFLSRDSRHLLPKLPGTPVQFPPPPLVFPKALKPQGLASTRDAGML